MEKKQIKKGINEIRSLRMSAEEKNDILNRIITPRQVSIGQGFWYGMVETPLFTRETFRMIFVVTAFILMLAGGGVAFASASETTLPGDFLYPIKIAVVEPLRDAMAFGSSAKVYVEELRIQRRLQEAAVLASQGKLTGKIEAEIRAQIEAGANKISIYLGEKLQGN